MEVLQPAISLCYVHVQQPNRRAAWQSAAVLVTTPTQPVGTRHEQSCCDEQVVVALCVADTSLCTVVLFVFAVAFGQAAGCRMCDVMMQQQDVAAQLHQQQQQQQQAAAQQPQEQQQPPPAAAAAEQQQQPLSEDEDVVQQELQHACAIHDAVQQCE
jgi:hypothetical protein